MAAIAYDMPCYHPKRGWRAKRTNDNGKRPVVFTASEAFIDMPVEVPCGKCIGCTMGRSRQWAVRCMHEASLYPKNCFITLTFKDKFIPKTGSLVKSDFQNFMKRLRRKYGSGVRYFHCGEYGERFARPHHHACLFNFDFEDKKLWNVAGKTPLYRSKDLEELWSDPDTKEPFGYASLGSVTFESAAYVARYVLKKQFGKRAAAHYGARLPEYTTMSRRPGIGDGWFQKYKGDVYPEDEVVLKECRTYRPPKYYDRKYELTNPTGFEIISGKRVQHARDNPDNTPERRKVKEEMQYLKANKLKRGFEAGE